MNNETPENFFKYMEAVLVSDLTTTERIIALAYAKSYNWTHENESRVGNYRIAAQVGCNEKTVVKTKASLTEKGWITSKRRFQKSNLTVPTIPAGFEYETEKAKQDALVEAQNATNNERAQKSRKTAKDAVAAKDAEIARLQALLAGTVLEAPESPSEVSSVLEDPETMVEPETAVQSFLEASEDVVEPEQTDEEILAENVFEEIAPVVEKRVEPSHHEKMSAHLDALAEKFVPKTQTMVKEPREDLEVSLDDFDKWEASLCDLGKALVAAGRSRGADSLAFQQAIITEAMKDDYSGYAEVGVRYFYAKRNVGKTFEGRKEYSIDKDAKEMSW